MATPKKHPQVAGRELTLPRGNQKDPPAGGRPEKAWSLVNYELLWLAVRKLSLAHIAYLAGPRTGAHDRGRVVIESAPQLKSHLATLMGVGPGQQRENLFKVIDLLVESGGLPRRISVPA
jgi:hypothetical protein